MAGTGCCERCVFWESDSEERDGMGECRRHSPVMDIAGYVRLFGPPEQLWDATVGFWPRSACDDWCGEFQPPATGSR